MVSRKRGNLTHKEREYMKLEKQGKQGRQRQPNARLRQQRLLRGWSLQRVVEELCKLAAEEERLPGVNEAMVSNWENGRKKPSPFYQERLCKLYRMSAAQLGFMEPLIFPSVNLLEVDQPGFSVFQPYAACTDCSISQF